MSGLEDERIQPSETHNTLGPIQPFNFNDFSMNQQAGIEVSAGYRHQQFHLRESQQREPLVQK